VTPTLLALALAVAAPLPKEKPKAEPGKLEGEWVVESYVQGGQVEAKRAGMHMSFADGKVIVKEEGGDIGYTTRPKANPPEIDLLAGTETIRGIYKVEGDTLLVCFPKSNKAERPTKFESPAGSNLVLMTLQRDKKKD
jgi:uncharacterized protein (TIGR03067 family)